MLLYYMASLQSFLQKPLRKDRGATAVEYGLMIAAIVAIIVGLAFTLGKYVFDAFNNTNDAWNTEVGPPVGP